MTNYFVAQLNLTTGVREEEEEEEEEESVGRSVDKKWSIKKGRGGREGPVRKGIK